MRDNDFLLLEYLVPLINASGSNNCTPLTTILMTLSPNSVDQFVLLHKKLLKTC